jgi:alkanesulfonate monooxygenase SsuD/methylene tetrahydromethanopterin reductase-like flavin-dependent oxidoreductase (luciferase family)
LGGVAGRERAHERTRPLTETYREELAKAPVDVRARAPKLGLTRHVHVADSDAEALDTAGRAYAAWYASNAELWNRFKTETRIFPPTLEDALRLGTAIVGSPATVAARRSSSMRASGANYLVSRLAFGDMPQERVMHAVDLFAAEIMPRFQPAAATSRTQA